MKKSNFYIPFLVALLFYIKAVAQSNTTRLSYNLLLDWVKNEHPLYKKAENINSIGSMKQKAGAGFYDPQLDANTYSKNFDGKNYYSVTNAEIKQGIFAGQNIKFGYEAGLGPLVNGEAATPANGLVYLGVEASLLQGLMMDKRRYEMLKGMSYKNISESERKVLQNELLFEAGSMYINWLKDLQIKYVCERFVETSSDRFNALALLAKLGERPGIDTIEAKLLLQNRILELNAAIMELNKSRYMLNSFVWLNDSSIINREILNDDNLSFIEISAINQFSSVINDLNINSPILQMYENKLALLNIEKRYKAELIKPKLDVKYNLIGLNNQSGNLPYYFNNNYKWGVSFSMPLFLRNPVNNYKIARLETENGSYELKNKSAELNTKLAAIKENILLLTNQLQIAKNTLAISRQLFEAEKIRFDNNESSLFLINTRETKMLESEIKLCETQHKFISNYIYYIYLSGNAKYSL